MQWDIYKKGFKAFLQLEKSLSAHSVEAYLRDIDKLTNYIEGIGESTNIVEIDHKKRKGHSPANCIQGDARHHAL